LASCTWMGNTFSRFGKFSIIILLNILCIPLFLYVSFKNTFNLYLMKRKCFPLHKYE
jgi:hypothetical protein